MFAAMIVHRLCKWFQQPAISNISVAQGLGTTKASALLANARTLELRSQASANMQDEDLQSALASMESGAASSQAPRDNFRSPGWGQPLSTVSRLVTVAYTKPVQSAEEVSSSSSLAMDSAFGPKPKDAPRPMQNPNPYNVFTEALTALGNFGRDAKSRQQETERQDVVPNEDPRPGHSAVSYTHLTLPTKA